MNSNSQLERVSVRTELISFEEEHYKTLELEIKIVDLDDGEWNLG